MGCMFSYRGAMYRSQHDRWNGATASRAMGVHVSGSGAVRGPRRVLGCSAVDDNRVPCRISAAQTSLATQFSTQLQHCIERHAGIHAINSHARGAELRDDDGRARGAER